MSKLNPFDRMQELEEFASENNKRVVKEVFGAYSKRAQMIVNRYVMHQRLDTREMAINILESALLIVDPDDVDLSYWPEGITIN